MCMLQSNRWHSSSAWIIENKCSLFRQLPFILTVDYLHNEVGSHLTPTFSLKIFRCLGVVLVHPVGNASTIMESFKDKFNKWKISNTGENVIAFRKFGHKVDTGSQRFKQGGCDDIGPLPLPPGELSKKLCFLKMQ